MKKIIILTALLTTVAFTINAQFSRNLKNVLNLKMTSYRGAHGATVAWHPIQKKYYAATAGNAEHQMGVFDVKGKMISNKNQTTLFDIRGLWYNPFKKTLQANGYNDNGWAEYKLNSAGIPVSVKTLVTDMNQPNEQSAGVYDPKNNAVYFFDNSTGNIAKYNMEGNFESTIDLHLGFRNEEEMSDAVSFDNDGVKDNYNRSSLVYTGIKGAEIGLLNAKGYENKKIELYDMATGFVTKELILPENSPEASFLDFGYCNGIYWLFDTEKRIWMGYR